MKRVICTATAVLAITGGASTAVAKAPVPSIPPINQIGAQYVTETGAASVACSQTPELIICYGLLDGAIIGGVWADGVFTLYVDPATAPTSAVNLDEHPDAALVRFYVANLTVVPSQMCPPFEADPASFLADFRGTLTPLDMVTLSTTLNLTASGDELEDLVVAAFEERLIEDCA